MIDISVIEQKKRILCEEINNDAKLLSLLNDFQYVLDDLHHQYEILLSRFKRYKKIPTAGLLTIWASFVATFTVMFYFKPPKKDSVQILWAVSLCAVGFGLLYFSITLFNVINFTKFPPVRKIFDTNINEMIFLSCTESVVSNVPIRFLDRRPYLFFFYKHKKKLVTLPKKKPDNVETLISWMNSQAMARFNSKEISLFLYSQFYHNKLTDEALEEFLNARESIFNKTTVTSEASLN